MDFAGVLELVGGFLDSRGYCWAVIGGLAMATYGIPRTTMDVDLVVGKEAQRDLVTFLEAEGYETLHCSDGYSNHLHANPEKGRLDVVYVSGETERRIFEQSRVVEVVGGKPLHVPRPEHLAAMKVFAMKNDPSRTFSELADIQFLLQLPGVDRQEIRAYFEKHGLGERYEEIETILDQH